MKKLGINTKFILLIYDVCAIIAGYSLCFFIVSLNSSSAFDLNFLYTVLIYGVSQTAFEVMFRMDKCVWSFASAKDYLYLALTVLCSTVLTMLVTMIFDTVNIAFFTAYITSLFLIISLVMLPRLVRILIFERSHLRENLTKNTRTDEERKADYTMLIGGGWTGNALLKELNNDPSEFFPICILDDDVDKQQMTIQDVPIVGNTYQIAMAVKKYHIKKIIFAIPSCDKEVRTRILNECVKTGCTVRAVPTMYKLITGASIANQTDAVKIEDLLGREQVKFDDRDVSVYVNNKVCMVTGGGGSIGSELCRQIAHYSPKRLIIVDIYENNAYDIQQELLHNHKDLNLVVEICSVADYNKMDLLFSEFKPEVVFHAAAHKHVPLMETVPEQAVKNNIVGTHNVCKLCAIHKAKTMVLISTDKAVNPTNVMGATKRCCEMIVKYYAQENSDVHFCMVRFGNVLGSNGSVIPLFKKQIAAGGPVTVTDKEITRYFMLIPEAVSLVLKCGAIGHSGEVFILDMGKPMKILSLAENLITLSGLEPYKDIDIKIVGLRPGEKLYEELLLNKEQDQETKFDKIFIGHQEDVDAQVFLPKLNKLIDIATSNDAKGVVSQLKEIIPTFTHK